MGRTQLLVDGDVVGLDDHTPAPDGAADFLFVSLQSAEGDVRTVVAVKQRNPAGGFGNGRLIRSMDEAGQAGCAYSRQPASGVGVDYGYRHRGSGKEAYLNLDQDHLTISVDGDKLYDAPDVFVTEARIFKGDAD